MPRCTPRFVTIRSKAKAANAIHWDAHSEFVKPGRHFDHQIDIGKIIQCAWLGWVKPATLALSSRRRWLRALMPRPGSGFAGQAQSTARGTIAKIVSRIDMAEVEYCCYQKIGFAKVGV
jgi:hypothetical protein